MSSLYSNNNTEKDTVKANTKITNHRYVHITEDIADALSPYAYKIYVALRYETDYSKDCSSVEKNVKFLMNKTGIRRTLCFKYLNELEHHGLIKRERVIGYQSKYWVAREYGYFLPKVTEDPIAHNTSSPVQDLNYLVHAVNYLVQHMNDIIINSFTNNTKEEKTIGNSCESPVMSHFCPKDSGQILTTSSNDQAVENIMESIAMLNVEDVPVIADVPEAIKVVVEPDKDINDIKSVVEPFSKMSHSQNQLQMMLANNPHRINEQALRDWLQIRRAQRAPVTVTGWYRMTKELDKCQQAGFDAEDCFAVMVSSGWRSLKADWFLTKATNKPGNKPYIRPSIV